MDSRSRTGNKRDDYFSFIVRGYVCFGNITKGRPYIYIYYTYRNRIRMSIYDHKQEIVIYYYKHILTRNNIEYIEHIVP